MDEENFNALVGKTLTDIKIIDKEEIFFYCSDGNIYKMYHHQSCCENVVIDDVCGDIKDLIGKPILKAEENSNDKNTDGSEQNNDNFHFTWTFYNIATFDGHVTIRWYGTSNGEYSERVSFTHIGNKN